MAFKNKFKVRSDLRDQIEKEAEGSGKRDPRILPYYKLDFGEKMTVLIVPDVHGNLWQSFSKHRPGLKVRSAGEIGCRYKMAGEECPVCQKGFEIYDQFKESNDPALKEEAKRWFSSDYTVASVIVLDTTLEIPEDEKQNDVKLWYLPHNVEKQIKNMVQEGELDPEDIPITPFVIKKTKNQGGKASYDESFFRRQTLTEDEEGYLEELNIEQYDFVELDLVPDIPTEAEAEEWLEKAIEVVEKDRKKPKKDDESSTKKSVSERLSKRKSQDNDDSSDDSEDDQDDKSSKDQEDKEDSGSNKRSALRDRLASARKRKSD